MAPSSESADERLIVALDYPDATAALDLVDRLEGATRWFKIGLELYVAEGNSLVAELQRRGYSIFLDLKFHDIPNTVASAVRSVARLGCAYADRARCGRTGHAGGGGGSGGGNRRRPDPARGHRPDQHG